VWSCQISRRFPLNDSAAGREVIPSYYRDYLPEARAAGRSFLFATDSWRASSDWADRLDYDRALLKQNNATSAALCAELADEFAAAGVTSAIAGVIGPRRRLAVRFRHDRRGSLGLSQSAG
jgi:homocysteine S-methyltransferase